MSQSRFSIVLVGVSALLRRPLVSRLRSAAFTARGDLPFRRLPLGGLAFGLTTSAFRHAPLRSCRSAGWPSGFGFRFSACTTSGLPLGELAFGLTTSAFGMHRFGVALGELVLLPSVSEIAARRVGSSAFRFGVCHSAGWCFRLPLRRLPLGGLAFGLTASAFRHAPLRDYPRRVGASARRVGSSAFRFGDCRWASWPSGSRLPLFGMRRSAPPHRRREGRRSTPTRHLFHFYCCPVKVLHGKK